MFIERATRISKLAIPLFFIAISAVQASEIRDEGNFFSAEGKREAERQIADIERKYNVSVDVETYQSIPADKRAEYDQKGKNAFFQEWMKERAKADRTTGLFILATREPSHLQVGIGQQAIRVGLTTDDRDAIRDALVSRFKSRDFDGGLTSALALTEQKLNEASRTFATRGNERGATAPTPTPAPRYGTTPPPPAATPHGSVIGSFFKSLLIVALVGLVLLAVIVWVLYRTFRRIFVGPAHRSEAPRPPMSDDRTDAGGGADF